MSPLIVPCKEAMVGIDVEQRFADRYGWNEHPHVGSSCDTIGGRLRIGRFGNPGAINATQNVTPLPDYLACCGRQAMTQLYRGSFLKSARRGRDCAAPKSAVRKGRITAYHET
jgi:hypothetical protein